MELVVEEKQRIDKYIASHTEYSRNQVQHMIEEDYVTVNNTPVSANYQVKPSEVISIKDGFIKEINVQAEKMDLDILYEDDDLLIVNKPSGMVVHPGNGNTEHTLVSGLLAYTNHLSDENGELRPGIVHRIDKDTSGILVIAKNNKAHELLSNLFARHSIKRTYIALLDGVFPHQSATIDAPIGRDETNRKRMTVTAKNSKKAITHLETLKRYTENTLVKLNLETGRTHQIRVHMKYIGYPVHNDPVYTNKKCTSFGQFLHSAELDMTQPITGKKIHVEAPLPKEFEEYLNTLEEYK